MRPRLRELVAGALFVGAVGLGFWHQQHRASIRGHVVERVIASAQCGTQLAARLSGLPEVESAAFDRAHHQVTWVSAKDHHRHRVPCDADGGAP